MNNRRLFFAVLSLILLSWPTHAQQVVLRQPKTVPAPHSEGLVSTCGLTCMSAYLLADLYVGGLSQDELMAKYPIVEEGGKLYVSAFLALDDVSQLQKLASFGVKVNGEEERMVSSMIPLDSFVEVAQSGICRQIDVAKKVELLNDRATRAMRSDAANSGHFLPGRFDGTDVVVGIIDIGFEYGHPSFYDTTGTRYRVKCVWDQNYQCSTHPAGYSYGKEFLTQSSILNAICSHTDETHGSHVAGIAAGAGGPGDARVYRGVAPNADLVLVATNMMTTGIYDGINYIKTYASSVGKPCVINMSLGSQVGPHDGTTLFDQMCDNYVGDTPGVLLCSSAGNDGGTKLHLMKEFDAATDTIVSTLVDFRGSTSGETYIDLWGMPGDTFGIQMGIVNLTTGNYEDVTYLYSSAYSTTYSTTLTDADGEACSLDIYCTSANASNGRPNITIGVHNQSQTSQSQYLCLNIVAHNTAVHAWANKANFESSGVSGLVDGDNHYTTGEIGIGRTMITVGSYMTRSWWTCLSGQTYGVAGTEGDLSSFSSRGPSLDGRMKPDIVGPGQMLFSSVNKHDQGYCNPNGYWVVGSTQFNGDTYYYATMQGTSMSCPAVAGCMALWLQANPQMTSTQAHQLLHSSGFQDNFTGVIPSVGSTDWGWGKINLYAGLPMTDDTLVAAQCHVAAYPYVETCEMGTECWEAADSEAETSSWHYNSEWDNQSGVVNHRENTALVSLPSEGNVNHVLISPYIALPAEGEGWTFSWLAGSYDGQGNTSDIYWVYVVSEGNEYLLYQGSLYNQHTLVRQGISLDNFRGMDIRLKIVHFAFPNNYGISLDNLTISQESVEPQVRILHDGTLEGPIRIAVGDTLEVEALVLNEVGVDTYRWTEQSGSQIIGSDNEADAKFVWNTDMATWISVYVSGPSGSDSYMREVMVGNVGVEAVGTVRVGLYPNPTTGMLNIVSDAEILSVEITDALGRNVMSFSGNCCDISDFPNGIYFVKVNTPSATVLRKVLKR